jgi:hypothetical protein
MSLKPVLLALLVFSHFISYSQAKKPATTDGVMTSFLFKQVDSLNREIRWSIERCREVNNRLYTAQAAVDFLSFLHLLDTNNLTDKTDSANAKDGENFNWGEYPVNVDYLDFISKEPRIENDYSNDSLRFEKFLKSYPHVVEKVRAGKIQFVLRQEHVDAGSAPEMIPPTPIVTKVKTAKELRLEQQLNQLNIFRRNGCNSKLVADYLAEEKIKKYSTDQKINNREVLIGLLKKHCQ